MRNSSFIQTHIHHTNLIRIALRKEKAEIEALTATVEKMRLEHEAAAKKCRVNEGRLNGLIKEHSTHIEFQDRMVSCV